MEKLNLYVGLLIPKAEAGRTTHVGARTFKTGNALKVGAMNTFQQLFTDLFELQTRKEAGTIPYLMLLLQPRVVSFHTDPDGHATVILGCRLTDVKDRFLMDSTFSGSSSSDERTPKGVVPGSSEAGKGSIERASSEAFEAAFKQMAGSVAHAIRTSVR